MNKSLNGIPEGSPREVYVNRHIGLFAFFTVAAGIFAYDALHGLASLAGILEYGPVRGLVSTPENSDYYSHIVLIPFVSAYFLFVDRGDIFRRTSYCLWGLGVAGCGVLTYGAALGLKDWLGQNDFASLATAGSLIFWWGGFLLAFGPEAFKTARFPLFFLLFAIPFPRALLDWFIYILQVGSTEVTEWLFMLTGTDYIRNGFIYRLPNITIEVAKECSGIRSSIALMITGVLAGHLFLRTGWRKLILLVAMVPFTIFKNGVRIMTLSLLAIYVDTKFITDSFLHHSGGFLFYLPALGLLGGLLWWFRKAERKKAVDS